MAKAVSAAEVELRKRARRRLLGAIALVLLAVIFLPMVLDKEPKPVTQDVVIQIPSQNQGQFVSKIVPVAPETKAPVRTEPQPGDKELAKSEAGILSPRVAPATTTAAVPKAATEPAPAATPAPAEPAKPREAKPAEKSKPEAKPAKPAPAKAEAKTAPAAAGQFVVQVAALADTAKAQAMKDQIIASGYAAYTESVPTASGPVLRVRAGPFATRAAAEAARDKLKGLGMAGNVTTK